MTTTAGYGVVWQIVVEERRRGREGGGEEEREEGRKRGGEGRWNKSCTVLEAGFEGGRNKRLKKGQGRLSRQQGDAIIRGERE
jgi:hypothetical protein